MKDLVLELNRASVKVGAGNAVWGTIGGNITNQADLQSELQSIKDSIPMGGGDADTVNGHTVECDVPANAKFTDTIYDDTELKEEIKSLGSLANARVEDEVLIL